MQSRIPRYFTFGIILVVSIVTFCAIQEPELLRFKSQKEPLDQIPFELNTIRLSDTNDCNTMLGTNNHSCAIADISTFAYNIFSHISKSEENVLLSPISIVSALALVLSGATKNSTCQSQMHKVLSVTANESIPDLSSHLSTQSKNSGVELSMANGIWIKGDSIREEYQTIVKEAHSAKIGNLPASYDPINQWISDATHQRIENMLSGKVDPLTVAVVISAVYFKGTWKITFDPEKTMPGMFTSIAAQQQRNVKFMNDERRMKIGSNLKSLGGATVVQLEYANEGGGEEEFVMLAMLPKDDTEKSMQSMISGLAKTDTTSEILESQMHHTTVRLSLPKFKLSYGTESLKPVLQEMGMIDAFEGGHAFDVMSQYSDIYLNDVFHKAIMEVTEEGTVAAAATEGIMMARSMPPPPVVVNFNRPFVVSVMHIPTKTPLFIGKVDNPKFDF